MADAKGVELYKKARTLIPGGTQLLSKRPEMFLPDGWPAYYASCKGVKVTDLDGRTYTDMTIAGVGACPLGYADPDVDAAVIAAIQAGNMCTLNVPEEIELAELLMELHPWGREPQMIRYARTGGEAMAVSVRIARAATGKEKILFCGYHGWHDWYLSANLADDRALDGNLLPGLAPAGVPRGLAGTTLPFTYNDTEGFKKLFNEHKASLAAVVMEPVRNIMPAPGFLEAIREATSAASVPLIFDEVTSGFRMNTGGIHMRFNVHPDIAVFAKGLGNGYPMAAILGRRDVMAEAQRSFISSTYWTDRIGPSAALAMIRKHRRADAGAQMTAIGTKVQDGWKALGVKHKLDIHIGGIPPLSHFGIECKEPARAHTAIVKMMLERGFLTSKAFYATYAHTDADVSAYLAALDDVLGTLGPLILDGRVSEAYSGPEAHAGFRRLT